MDVKVRLFGKVAVTKRGCWERRQAIDKRGYSRISFEGVNQGAHRVVAHLFHGLELTDSKLMACHKCDNKICVRPKHIYVGNGRTNHNDKVRRGRVVSNPHFGENHPRHKISDQTVLEIKQLRKQGLTYKQIGDMVGVSFQLVGGICIGKYRTKINKIWHPVTTS
jgi:hypothetical protein